MTSVIVVEIGLISEVYVFNTEEEASSAAVELGNEYFKKYVGGVKVPFKTYGEVNEFQYSFHAYNIEIKMVDVTEYKKGQR